jgi:predicted TIM-barrel fold metal-dependent hydrolase
MSDYRLISADSHFVEPPRMWAERSDRRFRDRAPHAEKLEGKPGEFLVCEDVAPAPLASFFSAGVPPKEIPEFMKRGFNEAPRAVHDPAERIKDQDRDGVDAEVIYTSSMGMPLFGVEDAEFRAACFRAFNDWATDYCTYNLKRLIPLGLITLEDIPAAVAELERIKRRRHLTDQTCGSQRLVAGAEGIRNAGLFWVSCSWEAVRIRSFSARPHQ